MLRVLAIADEVSDGLRGGTLDSLRPDLILSAGDLPFEYLENLVSRTDVPLLFVPGNHDPALHDSDRIVIGPAPGGPAGCVNVDARIVEASGLQVAGLGGSVRYRPGPNQYSQAQMSRRALRLALRARLTGRRVDILLTHSPARGYGDAEDPAHIGLTALNRLVKRLQPRLLIHGHNRIYGPKGPDQRIGSTVIVNAIPYRLLEV